MSERSELKQKHEQYEQAKQSYTEGELSDEEFERRIDGLLSENEDFLDYERTSLDQVREAHNSTKSKLSYYSLPILLLAPVVLTAILFNPIVALTTAVPLMLVGGVLWGYLKLRSITSDS